MKKSFFLPFLFPLFFTISFSCHNAQMALVPPVFLYTSTPTVTPTITLTPTITSTPTVTPTPTITLSPTPTNTGIPSLSFSCNTDTYAAPATGLLTESYSQDMIALCNGWLIVGDRIFNQIKVLNAFSGAVSLTFQLNALPGDMRLDAAKSLLFVTLESTAQLAKIDLMSGVVSYIPLAELGFHLCIGNSNKVFVCVGNGSFGSQDDGTICIVDEISGVVKTLVLPIGGYTVYDKVHDRLFVGNRNAIPAELRSFSFNAATTTLSAAQTITMGGSGNDLALSPDGTRLAYPTWEGNGYPLYTIWDFDPMDLNTVAGSWNTGTYPAAGDFSRDGSIFATSNGTAMMIFDMNHVLRERSIDLADGVHRIRISGGNNYVFGVSGMMTGNLCQIYWMSYP